MQCWEFQGENECVRAESIWGTAHSMARACLRGERRLGHVAGTRSWTEVL